MNRIEFSSLQHPAVTDFWDSEYYDTYTILIPNNLTDFKPGYYDVVITDDLSFLPSITWFLNLKKDQMGLNINKKTKNCFIHYFIKEFGDQNLKKEDAVYQIFNISRYQHPFMINFDFFFLQKT